MLLPDFPWSRTITTRWMDEDFYGHVNNVVYYSYFDTVVNGYLMAATGTDIRTYDEVGVVAETQCRFLRQLRFPADVVAGLALERRGRTSVIYRIGLYQGDEPAPAALGRFVHVYVDQQSRASTAVPPDIAAAVDRLEANALPDW